MSSELQNSLVGETILFDDWKKDGGRFKEGDDIIFKAYVHAHGRGSDISKPSYLRSLEAEDTLVRVVSDRIHRKIQAIWYIRRAGEYMKARSGAPRRDDLSVEERSEIYSRILDIVPELDLPMLVEPDMRFRALSDTFDRLGLSTVWHEDELRRLMGEDYDKTHGFKGNNKYGQARFAVRSSLGREFERRAYVLYPQRMVKPKTIVRVIGSYEGWDAKDGEVERNNYTPMVKKDGATSQTRQGDLFEWPGGNVDPIDVQYFNVDQFGEESVEAKEARCRAAIREFREETGIDISGVPLHELGSFVYQYYHAGAGGVVYQPTTTVYRATFSPGKIGEWPAIEVVQGTEDRHSSGEWLDEKAVRGVEVGLTRASNLMMQKFLK